MNYLPQVTEAKRVRGFVIATRFDDGTEKHIDVSRLFRGPVFKPLKNEAFLESSLSKQGPLPGLTASILPRKRYMTLMTLESRTARTEAVCQRTNS
jgi:hypothetical protein